MKYTSLYEDERSTLFRNEDILQLGRLMPVGTPVTIR
jgi:hypothetical protein